MKKKEMIRIFVAHQVCACAAEPDCCAAPGQSGKEIKELKGAIEKDFSGRLAIEEIRDTRVLEKFPAAARLFRKYGYNALPIIMAGSRLVAYGIPDKEFILNSIQKRGIKCQR